MIPASYGRYGLQERAGASIKPVKSSSQEAGLLQEQVSLVAAMS
jgi:hypothetical protein